MISKLKKYLYKRSLPALTERNSLGLVPNIDQARSIGILFDATEISNRKAVLEYTNQLKKQGKSVHSLGYIPIVDQEATFDFNFFTKKDTTWYNTVKGEGAQRWLSHEYDALICLYSDSSMETEYLSLHARAALKIGPVATHPDCYDLMLDMKESSSLQQIIKQYTAILAKTAA